MFSVGGRALIVCTVPRYGIASPFELAFSSISMVPLQTFADKAAEIVQRAKDAIAHDADRLPPGLKEQYDLQLKLLEDPAIPDFEILHMPFMFPTPLPEPDKPYITLICILSRPFSRGTIVRTVPARSCVRY